MMEWTELQIKMQLSFSPGKNQTSSHYLSPLLFSFVPGLLKTFFFDIITIIYHMDLPISVIYIQ